MYEIMLVMKADVLIIEDVKEMSDLVAMYLGKEGMTVKQAESAEDAFSILENYMLKLTSDYRMADWHDALKEYMSEM